VTRTQLESVRAANALPHTLRYDQLAPYHVSFDELCGNTAVEGELAYWLAHGGRVALIGPSGSGKSSALAWVLANHVPQNLAVLRIPIALADDETVKTTAGFARHLIRRVIATARLADNETGNLRDRAADTIRRGGRGQRRSHTFGLNAWVLKGELARELTRSGEEFEEQIGAGEVVEGLQRLVELFRARDTDPVLVLDDTDTWIARPHDEQPAELADAFFNRNVRMLASEIDCGFILAVHTAYLELPAYREIAQRLERIHVPQLGRPQADLARILTHRLEIAGLDIALDQVFEPEALAMLASAYEDLPDVRRAIAIAATAVRLTLDEQGFDRVPTGAVRAAVAESMDDASV
jgi:energy-coupling factor transporter ATP-binding protein EcfA2